MTAIYSHTYNKQIKFSSGKKSHVIKAQREPVIAYSILTVNHHVNLPGAVFDPCTCTYEDPYATKAY